MGVTQVTNDITNAKTEEIFEIIYSCVDHIFEEKRYTQAKIQAEMRWLSFLIV